MVLVFSLVMVYSSGERAKETASRTPVLRHSPEPQMPFFLGEVALTYGIRLGECHSPQIWTPYNPTLLRQLPLLRSELPGPECRGLGILRGVSD